MKSLKKFAVLGLALLIVGAMSVTALAAYYKTPGEIVAGLAKKTVDDVIREKTESGKTYGTIANEAGKLPEFKAQMLEAKKAILQEKVADGTITQERADEIIVAIEQNQAICDGTGSGRIGREMGAGFGKGLGQGQGLGMMQGRGMRQGRGRGQGCGLGL